jgi:hypothetical protein
MVQHHITLTIYKKAFIKQSMKKLNFLIVLITVGVLGVASCQKGDVGPAGATGTAGANGTNGAAGTAGADGSIIYSGTSAPDALKGVAGDFYINTANGQLYGPKTIAGWGVGFSLKGPAGAAGATGAKGADGKDGKDGADGANGVNGINGKNGSQILSGTGVPAAGLGAVGDYYFDKGSDLLYGPKIVSGWGVATNLKGSNGAPGTANVIYSGWNYATNFRDTTADNTDLHAGDLSAPKLTSAILNSGTVQVYFTFGGGVYTLPYTSYAGGKLNTMSYWPRLGHFIITRFTADNSNSVALSTLLQYRYVIIPGGITADAAKHVNLNDYEAVRKYYRIAD